MAKELVKAPESLSVWMSNMKELVARQPKLGAVLHAYVQKHGHTFEHFETKTPSGTWIEGLSTEPFFQSDEAPNVGWTKKSREVPVFFQYGIGAPSYLFKVIRSLPNEALSLVVAEPNIELLAYVLHMTHVYMAMPKGASLTFLALPREAPAHLDALAEKTGDEDLPLSTLTRILRDEALEMGLNVYGLFTVFLSRTAVHAGEEAAFFDDILGMAKAVREWVVVRLGFLGNSSHDTMLGLRQMSLMSPWISYGYQYGSIMKAFAGKPFVVVSAGPSLEKNYELLRDIQDKCVILANDATLKKLLAAGITPHIVCALERGTPTYNIFFKQTVLDYPDECAKILLISQAVCTPKIYGTWPGPKMIIGKSELPVDQWFIVGTLHGTLIPSGSSVAHMCFGVAATMGASSIALIGQDLAYGEDGTTHAYGVFKEKSEELKKEVPPKKEQPKKKRRSQWRCEVPGALGGEVETNQLWLSFLRMFESRINMTGAPVYDCTEGGALIKGTIVKPFAEYISEHVEAQEAFEMTPAAVVVEKGAVADKKGKYDSVRPSFEKAYADLDAAGDLIVKIVKSLDEVSAAAILPQKRVQHAAETGKLLDTLNRLNPMFAFIAQSYLYLSTTEIAVTRFLDNVETVERWVSVHREIVEGHVAVVRFIKIWLDYADQAMAYYVDRDLPLKPLAPDESLAEFERVCGEFGDGHDQIALRNEMDKLFAFADMVRDGWPGGYLWKGAMFLLQESRSEEAGGLMKAAADSFEDMEMPEDEIYSFLKDYARVMITPDLCHVPNYEYATTLLENAVDLCGSDGEIEDLRTELRQKQHSYLIDLTLLSMPYRKQYVNAWYAARKEADEALLRGDPMTAMRIVWDAICAYGKYLPRVAAPYLHWLVSNMEKFFGADDARYTPVIDELLDEMVARFDILKSVPIPYTVAFMRALVKHGAQINLSRSEKDDVPAESAGVDAARLQ